MPSFFSWIVRRERSPIRVERGERLLADAAAEGGHLGGTREALYLLRTRGTGALGLEETIRIPWEEVQAADWDQDTSTLHVSEVGSWGEVRPDHSFTLESPGLLDYPTPPPFAGGGTPTASPTT